MSSVRNNPFSTAESLATLPRSGLILDDRRDLQRWPAQCDVWLLDLEGMTVLRCQTDNVSSGGLHCTVPIGFGLAVGQRYELRIRRPNDDLAAVRPAWAGCYGTIIRTRLITDGITDRLAVAVRFDSVQPFEESTQIGNA